MVPADGVIFQSVVVAAVMQVDSIVNVRVGDVTYKSISARMVKVYPMRVFRGIIVCQDIIVAVVVEVDSRIIV